LRAAALQVKAAIDQAKATAKLAEVNFGRSKELVASGIVAKADLDEKTAVFDSRKADVKAQEANLQAADEAIRAQTAEVARVTQLFDFKRVTAPWDGIITQRNCAIGNLITPSAIAAGRDLFRLSDMSKLRVFVNVPQSNIGDIKVGQKAVVKVPELRASLTGSVIRTSNALENQSRTLLAEVNVVNPGRTMLPGMYTQVVIETSSARQLILVPGDTIVTRAEGIFVAVVGAGNKIQFRKIEVGRDFGTEVEAVSGLSEGDQVVVNPSDDVKNGVVVKPIARK
jgi:RND family efflux transporter MFP subunit